MTGAECLNDEEKGQLGHSGMIHGVQHAGSVPDVAFWVPDAPEKC
jgi:hypothetical protein